MTRLFLLVFLVLTLAGAAVHAANDADCPTVLKAAQTEGVKSLLAGDPTAHHVVYIVVPFHGDKPMNPVLPRWEQIEEQIKSYQLQIVGTVTDFSKGTRRVLKVSGMTQHLNEAAFSPYIFWMGQRPNRKAVKNSLKRETPSAPPLLKPVGQEIDPRIPEVFSKNKDAIIRVYITPRKVDGGVGVGLPGVVRQRNQRLGNRWHLVEVRLAQGREPSIYEINRATYELCLEFPHLVFKLEML